MIIEKTATLVPESRQKWIISSLKEMLENTRITHDTLLEVTNSNHKAEDFTDEAVMKTIKDNDIVYTPFLAFRGGDKRCRCGTPYFGMGALSRFDNETEICPLCGTKEAFADMKGRTPLIIIDGGKK